MLMTMVTILPVFLIIAVGYGAARVGVLGPGAAQALNRFVIWIALPCLLFHVVATTDWARLWHGGFVLVSVGGSFIVFALGLLAGKLRGLGPADRAVDGLNASYSNTIYIGLPLLLLVLGPESRPFVVLAGTLTLIALFAAAVMLIELADGKGHGVGHALRSAIGGIVRNPVLVAPMLGLLWWATGLPLPGPVDSFFGLLGAAASPAALVAIGLFLAERPLRAAVSNRSVVGLSALKLIVHPAVTAILAWHVVPLEPHIALTAIALGALPTGTGPFMVAEFYARDGRVTSGTILLSTVLSVVTIAGILTVLRA